MNIIDLSMPVESGHLRWPVERGVKGSFAEGDLFEVSWVRTSCHGFTHMDAPRHMVPGGPTLSDLDLARVVGRAAVIDLSDVQPNEALDTERLRAAAAHLAPGEIALFRTCWDQQRDWHDAAFWRDAPYLTRDAAEWLLARQVTACAFDFPQDFTIRLLLDGEVRPIAEHVTHDVLLRNNVTLIEYLVNTSAVTGPHTFLVALPIRLDGADGAPSRVIAIDDMFNGDATASST
ncbi:MAG: cyclase family protein [Pseudomonadota bacterium]